MKIGTVRNLRRSSQILFFFIFVWLVLKTTFDVNFSPAEVSEIDDAGAREAVQDLFEDRRVVNFQGTVTLTALTLGEMTWVDPAVGVVPGDEKADPGNTISLEAHAP